MTKEEFKAWFEQTLSQLIEEDWDILEDLA